MRTAEYLGVSVTTLRKFLADGKISAHRIGDKLIKCDCDVLDKYLEKTEINNR